MSSPAAAARAFRAAARPGLAPPLPGISDLVVVTYNMLADKYATSGHHDYCPGGALAWAPRAPRLLAELDSYDADVLCLQEVERPFMEEALGPHLAAQGRGWLFYGRRRKPTDAVPGPEEGVCLAYRTDRLEPLATATVRFGDLAASRLPGGCSLRTAPAGAAASGSPFLDLLRDREDGAALALLRDKQAGRVLLAAATHLHWDPRHPDVKAAQAALLCAAAREFLENEGVASRRGGARGAATVPLIIGGDFNSLPLKTGSDAFDEVPPGGALVSGAVELLTRGAVPASHQDHPAARRPGEAAALREVALTAGGLRLASAASAAWGAEPPFTTRTPGFSGTLDYVFYTPHCFDVAEALEMPYPWRRGGGAAGEAETEGEAVAAAAADQEAAQAAFPPIPNAAWPSDHLAMGVQLRWR